MITSTQKQRHAANEQPLTQVRSGAAALPAALCGSYQALLARLGWPHRLSTAGPFALGLTSCERGEGVSTVAAHLALTAATAGPYRIALVDLSLSAPRATGNLGDLAADLTRLDQTLQATSMANLWRLAFGRQSADPAAGFSQLPALMKSLKESFHLVVVDLPAVAVSGVAQCSVAVLDATLLVIEAERVPGDVARRTTALLTQSGAKLLGVVLNKRPEHIPRWLPRV